MLIAALLAAATVYTIQSDDSPVTFHTKATPGFLNVDGKGAKLEGTAEVDAGKVTGDFTVNLAAIKTGIDLRDEHMKTRYLDVAKFPQATLRLLPTDLASKEFTGTLTIKGTSKPIHGTFTAVTTPTGAMGEAAFTVRFDDYPLGAGGRPNYLGVTVAETADINVKFKAVKK